MNNTFHTFYTGKNVLVTGGCGFIGSHLVEKLVSFGANVTIIDDLSTGSLDNIIAIQDKVTLLKKSITEKKACEQAVKDNDVIFHLAAFISVPGSISDPFPCHAINIDGTFYLLDAAQRFGCKRFVFSSSSAVYGPRENICLETDTYLNPASPYGATKLIGELYCKQFDQVFNVPCVMLRYFNVYGPRQNPSSTYAAVVAKFNYQLMNNQPLTIFGDGSQTRDFISVHEVVTANLLVGMAPESMVRNEIFNIGSGKSISIVSLAQKMKEYHKADVPIIFSPARPGDVQDTQMSAAKYKKLKESFSFLNENPRKENQDRAAFISIS